jgi:hypothetical protein
VRLRRLHLALDPEQPALLDPAWNMASAASRPRYASIVRQNVGALG